MHVLFLTGRETQYSRNEVLLRAFQRFATVEVLGEHSKGSILFRSLKLFLTGLTQFRSRKYDLIFIGFYGHLLMLPIGVLAKTPILFDAFLSTYDTLTADRGRYSPQSPGGKLAFWLDQTSCRLARFVLLDTPLYADYFSQTFKLPSEKIAAIPVGCNEDLFYPHPALSNKQTHILYYTSYLPLHGVETVVRAAALLKDDPTYRFEIIGNGQTYSTVRQLEGELDTRNTTFTPPIPLPALPEKIASAQICLGGHFGTSAKAGRVVPGKIYQLLAMARPVIAADTPANQGFLTHAESAYFVPSNDPTALATAIRTLHQNPTLCTHIAEQGRRVYESIASEAVITAQLKAICAQII